MAKAKKSKNKSSHSLSFVKEVSEEDLKQLEANKQRGGFFKLDPVKRAEKLKTLLVLLKMSPNQKLKFESIDRTVLFAPIYELHKNIGITRKNQTNKLFRTYNVEKIEVVEYGKKKSKTVKVGSWLVEKLPVKTEEVKEKLAELVKRYEAELENLENLTTEA